MTAMMNALAAFRRSGAVTRIALLVLALVVLAVIAGPWLWPVGADDMVGEPWSPMSWAHPFGTDQLGRDMLARVIEGGRNSLALAAVIAAGAFALGTGLGLVAAFCSGAVDAVLSRVVDLLMSFPPLIFALLVISLLGNSIPVLIAVLVLFECLRIFRLTRSLAMDIAVQDYVVAARLRGEGLGWLLGRELLPNTMGPLAAELAIRFMFSLLFISSLSFLGLGVPPPAADWGGMVRDNAPAIGFGLTAPLFPAGMIAVVAVCVNLLADALLRRKDA
ncbi:ABC transporter protein inner membrane protein [Bordetella hinzii]|uniref:ABC transporter permease n=1 Tax=Bordetella hinzii TaxID=103855 RepID=UPI000402D5EF|nr:ABC transporter permease [Bordetella hinzii]AKQ55019.1 Glutathione transport system permease protein GsiD [Bordetella hinzii]KCB23974.1 ABC transporter, permease protein [Bordetella hinzii L60]KCB50773.1 ABC transporter, permease protein [Bordetella hinzii 1277]SNV93137.1 ABC transporter protein inner membrane protein [Bordetella hinzii]